MAGGLINHRYKHLPTYNVQKLVNKLLFIFRILNRFNSNRVLI